MKNKVSYVKAYPKPIYEERIEKVPTGEKKKNLFGLEKKVLKKVSKKVRIGWSDCEIDGVRLTEDIQKTVDELNELGFSIESISPITSGKYNYATEKDFKKYDKYERSSAHEVRFGYGWGYGWGHGYGYGFSFTEGVCIISIKE